MAHQQLDGAQIGTRFQQVHREGVTQRMWRDRFADTGPLSGSLSLLGIGVAPALTALFLYSLFPIVRNTYTGVRDANPGAAEAALACGMSPRQVLAQVRFPLAAPVIFAGIRTAGVLCVGSHQILVSQELTRSPVR